MELRSTGHGALAAIVRLRGEHDIASAPEIEDVLAPLHGDLMSDLSECDLVDSSVISLVVTAEASLRREGRRLELLADPNTSVARTLELAGVSRLIPVRASAEV